MRQECQLTGMFVTCLSDFCLELPPGGGDQLTTLLLLFDQSRARLSNLLSDGLRGRLKRRHEFGSDLGHLA